MMSPPFPCAHNTPSRDGFLGECSLRTASWPCRPAVHCVSKARKRPMLLGDVKPRVAQLGAPARCPFSPFFFGGRVPLLKQTTEKSRYPYSNLSIGGPSQSLFRARLSAGFGLSIYSKWVWLKVFFRVRLVHLPRGDLGYHLFGQNVVVLY